VKPTLLEAKQLLAGIQQANEEILAALTSRLTSQYAVSGKHADDRVLTAIRNHREAIAKVWEPSPDNGISAAARKTPPSQHYDNHG
jgi:hypothetical protein